MAYSYIFQLTLFLLLLSIDAREQETLLSNNSISATSTSSLRGTAKNHLELNTSNSGQMRELETSIDANFTIFESQEGLGELMDNVSAGLRSLTSAACRGKSNEAERWYTYWYNSGSVLPVVISTIHDGSDVPSYMSDRTSGHNCGRKNTVTTQDTRSSEVALIVRNMMTCILKQKSKPIFLRMNVKRTKIDMNRKKFAATCSPQFPSGAPCANRIYDEFMEKAEDARKRAMGGLWLDFHARTAERAQDYPGTTQLGYGISLEDMGSPRDSMASRSTLRNVARRSGFTFKDIVRGNKSLGGRLVSPKPGIRKVYAVPRPAKTTVGEHHFTGGEMVRRFGRSGSMDAIQVEMPPNVRSTGLKKQQEFAFAFAHAVIDFLRGGSYDISTEKLIKGAHNIDRCQYRCTTRFSDCNP